MSVLITGPERMRELNRKWRGEDRAASILSFPQGENPRPHKVLGDIAISLGEGSSKQESSFDEMLVHGILHLLGYRHDTEREARRMEKRSEEVMKALGG